MSFKVLYSCLIKTHLQCTAVEQCTCCITLIFSCLVIDLNRKPRCVRRATWVLRALRVLNAIKSCYKTVKESQDQQGGFLSFGESQNEFLFHKHVGPFAGVPKHSGP